MGRKSNFPPAGGNKFHRIKEQRLQAEGAGIKVINLSVGEPSGPSFDEIRFGIMKALASDNQDMYRYQDNECHPIPDFPRRFVQIHVSRKLSELTDKDVAYVPTPGTKSMLQVIIEAMNSWSEEASEVTVCTMTNPGYDSPVVQAQMVRGTVHRHLPLRQENDFLFGVADLKAMNLPRGRTIIMTNFPHNPTGIIVDRIWWHEMCAYCEQNDYWLVCDSAYAILPYGMDACTLTDIAPNFPGLNWAEAFSASKAGNNTGLRTGAIIGSPEFVGDIKRVKGDVDSGFVAPVAVGILYAFENHRYRIHDVRSLYQQRSTTLIRTLEDAGMKLTVNPRGGFFVLFDAPAEAFGKKIADAEAFNNIMVSKTGVLGVPFGKWIRYAVCATDVIGNIDAIQGGFAQASVRY